MNHKIFYVVLVLSLSFIGFKAIGLNNVASQEPQYAPSDPSLKVATFAGGCFWCVEAGFEQIPGVAEAVSGYSGGIEKNPNYQQVASGATGHTEAVQVYYDPQIITYEGLLQALWRMMDPTDVDGQFVDRGKQYRPAIFFHNAEQKRSAEASIQALQNSGRYDKPVALEVTQFESFYDAEEYHQDYYKKNPIRYKYYTFNSGRYQFIDKIWGEDREIDYAQYRPKTSEAADRGQQGGLDQQAFQKPSDEQLRKQLTSIQYKVTQQDATEPSFNNKYWDEKRAGIYVDVVSGEPLFLSTDKYKSGTGWPSFVRPISLNAVVEREDRSWYGGVRTEIRSALADSHSGHVFKDGPKPTGLRYCMNSAALKFILKADMDEAGYGQYVDLVKKPIS
ncbi:MAG: peptide methionine sulfoxide reductase msrA/msrB [Bermanella sp.]|jgi:peptide methionine sulfoxide reductase msrA/msrB|uniref:peptide-methionine (S)-S-oxide reductase MsrA n=1 Tax=Glaciecola sp. 33A TaxID=2057807 RepID=UPI000C334849|nr:peptide-methionine (S)-S-oxide reductase MsrA [Glaciecola sp. 33A]PKI01968.1 methionine sulfoxide reductase [Glaciecola sp. 33A]